MDDELNDSTIVQGLRRGDQDAWDSLCRKYSDRIWRYVARLVGDPDGVADVFQETMLAVAKSGRAIADDSRLWSWLAAISQKQAALYWRKRYRDRTSCLDFVEVPSTSTSPDDPVDALSRRETVNAVRRLLAEMKSEYAALLSAKYLDGLSVQQIVAEWGGSYESIRSRLARARQEFRNRYERLVATHGEDELSVYPDRSPDKSDYS